MRPRTHRWCTHLPSRVSGSLRVMRVQYQLGAIICCSSIEAWEPALYRCSYNDIKNLKAMAHEHTVVLADDANDEPVLQDMQRAADEGITEPWEVHVAGDQTDKRFTSESRYLKHFGMTRYKWP